MGCVKAERLPLNMPIFFGLWVLHVIRPSGLLLSRLLSSDFPGRSVRVPSAPGVLRGFGDCFPSSLMGISCWNRRVVQRVRWLYDIVLHYEIDDQEKCPEREAENGSCNPLAWRNSWLELRSMQGPRKTHGGRGLENDAWELEFTC